MATFKIVGDNPDDWDMVPMDQYESDQAQRQQRAEVARYIEPDTMDIMPSVSSMPMQPHHVQVNEKADPVTAAKGFTIRFAGICVLLLFLSIGSIWVITGQIYILASIGLLGLLGAITFIVLTRQDYQHSAAGTERQKTAELGRTLRQQLDHNHDYRVQKMKLDHQFRMEKTQ